MNKPQPDKWIRKAIYDAFNNTTVDGFNIPIFDYEVTEDVNTETPSYFVLMTSQSTQVDKNNKCEYIYNSQILLDIVTYYHKPGNTGSRLLADNILESLKDATNDLSLDVASGLTIINQSISFPSDIVTLTDTENVFRKFLRIELDIR